MRPFTPPDPKGMRDYFDVYERHEPQMNEHLMAVCSRIPSLAQVIKAMPKEQLEAQRKAGLQTLRAGCVDGNWGPLLEQQKVQGAMYANMNIPFGDWYELISAFEKVMIPHLVTAYAKEPERLSRSLTALSDYIDQGMGFIAEEYLKVKERIINQQAEAIQELSTPVLQVGERLLLIPLIGVLDTHRARSLTESLLRAVRDYRAKVVVIDITGVAAVDSKVANHLFQTVSAAKLMGAQSIITGLSAEVANSLVVLGVDVNRLNAVGDLQGGLEEANRILAGRGANAHTDPPAP